VWSTIADFGSVHTYLPSVSDCRVEGDGIGARRHLRQTDGGATVSELTELDHDAMAMGYRIVETSLPLVDYTSRLSVRDVEGGCEVTYASRCIAPDAAAASEIEAFLAVQLDAGVAGLRALHEPIA
jgi:hypothetical protein